MKRFGFLFFVLLITSCVSAYEIPEEELESVSKVEIIRPNYPVSRVEMLKADESVIEKSYSAPAKEKLINAGYDLDLILRCEDRLKLLDRVFANRNSTSLDQVLNDSVMDNRKLNLPWSYVLTIKALIREAYTFEGTQEDFGRIVYQDCLQFGNQ